MSMIALFVYGTLKSGFWNHDRFCREAVSIENAIVRGKLYELSSRIPVLHVPEEDILALGSSEILADVAVQKSFSDKLSITSDYKAKDWQAICGELMVFPDAQLSLPPIDRLEGFTPELPSLYRRVLVPVLTDGDRHVTAWCYVAGDCVIQSMSLTRKTSWP